MNRRETLKTLGLGLALPNINLVKPEKTIGVAILGLGNYGKLVAEAMQQATFGKLVALVSGNPEKAKTWANKYGVAEKNIYTYDTMDALAQNPEVDLVYVCTPNGLHEKFVVKVAGLKKHVLCEKPMANTAAEAQNMIDACQKAGVQLGIGYRLHFEPHYKEMIRMGREKEFGAVRYIEASFGFTIGDPKQWRLNKELSGGGPLMDVGVYCIQGIRHVLGEEPVSVQAQFGPINDPIRFSTVEESISFQMQFPSGALSNTFTTYRTNLERQNNFAEKGLFSMSPAYSYGPLKGETPKGPMKIIHKNHQLLQMEGVCESLLLTGKMPSHISGEEGLKDMKIIDAIYASAKEGGKKMTI